MIDHAPSVMMGDRVTGSEPAARCFGIFGWWFAALGVAVASTAVINTVAGATIFTESARLARVGLGLVVSGLVALTWAAGVTRAAGQRGSVVSEVLGHGRFLLCVLGLCDPRRIWRDAAIGFTVGVVAIWSVVLASLVVQPEPVINDPRQPIYRSLTASLTAALIGPLPEEWAWRGTLLILVAAAASLARRYPRARAFTILAVGVAICCNAVSFGLFHQDLSWWNAVSAGWCGLLYAIIAVQRRSLIPAYIAHVTYNATAMLLMA